MTAPAARAPMRAQRGAAFLWALLHAPIILLIYRNSLGIAFAPLSGGYRAGMAVAWLLEAAVLALLIFVIALPFSLAPRLYRWAAPAVAAAGVVVLSVDSALYEALAFHINGLVARVAFQPGALAQIGIPMSEFGPFAAGLALFAAADIALGARFIARAPWHPRRRWMAAAAVLLLVADRLLVGTMNFTGGRLVLAAADVLPLQIPLRMNTFLERLTGRPHVATDDALALAAGAGARQPIPPDSVRFTRRPDIVLALVESLRADFFTPDVMPRLWQRAGRGARFTHHYASASSTHYALFSVVYGLNAGKLEAVVGAGRPPLLFGALRANGYQMRLITASSVDWMGMKQTVFRDVAADLDTEMPGAGVVSDSAMLARAGRFVARADDRPLFLLLFFDGTHFNYTYHPRARRFTPEWDGRGGITTARVDPALMKRRAMNAAYDVDWELDDFLADFARRRGRPPLLLVTGDHGEAFREHGRVGHGAGVAEEEIHVPMVLVDDSVAPGVVTGVTSHVDIAPTLLHLLGDRHPPATWSDGVVMTSPPPGRFVISTAGWIPRYAVIGDSLKAQFFRMDAGLGSVTLTGPGDEPIADADARLHRLGPQILRALHAGR